MAIGRLELLDHQVDALGAARENGVLRGGDSAGCRDLRAAQEIENGHGLLRAARLDQSLSDQKQRGTERRFASGVLLGAKCLGECRGGVGRSDPSEGNGGGVGGFCIRVGEELRQGRDGNRVLATTDRANHSELSGRPATYRAI